MVDFDKMKKEIEDLTSKKVINKDRNEKLRE